MPPQLMHQSDGIVKFMTLYPDFHQSSPLLFQSLANRQAQQSEERPNVIISTDINSSKFKFYNHIRTFK
jgi:hypothetical protein